MGYFVLDNENGDKPEKTMEDTMRETMANIQARESAPEEKVETPAQVEAVESAPVAKATPPKDEATGRFKPKVQHAAKSAAKPQAEQNTEDPAQEGAAKVAEAVNPATPKPVSQAPSSWSPAAKAKWDQLDPAIRAEVLKRESDAQRGVQQYAEKAKRFDAIDAVIKPQHKQQLTGHYGSVERGISELLALSDFAGRDPYGFVAYISQQRGLDPNQLIQIMQRGGQPAQMPQAPQQAANPLEARLAALESGIQKTQTQGIESTLKEFTTQADEQGNLLHPHFEELRNEIAMFLESGKSLQEAYDMAVWASPAHREQVLLERSQKQEQEQKALREKQAKEARQASTLANVTRPNAGATPSKPTSWEDTLRAQHKRIQAGSAA